MDNLEKYFKAHREAFDKEAPEDEVWQRISGKLDEREKQLSGGGENPYTRYWKVAAIILLVLSSVLVWDKMKQDTAQAPVAQSTMEDDFARVEAYYTTLIAEKRTSLQLNKNVSAELLEAFDEDLKKLEMMYQQLKEDYSSAPDTATLADAMVQNLRMRIEILNKQLQIIERLKTDTQDESINI